MLHILSISTIVPSKNYNAPSNTVDRVKLEFNVDETNSLQPDEYKTYINKFKTAIFEYDNKHYVLVKDLAELCNYPSSYQLINKIVRQTKRNKRDFLKITTTSLNESLLSSKLINDQQAKSKLFYISLSFLYNSVGNKSVIIDDSNFEVEVSKPKRNEFENKQPSSVDTIEEKILISQVFPQYGLVDSTLPLNHATFNTLNNITKLNYYKLHGIFSQILGRSLTATERELLYKENDYSDIEISEERNENEDMKGNEEEGEKDKKIRKFKPIKKPKKNITNVDPNSIDLTESILPGQGLIQEFSINHICKVPNYFITTNHMNAAQTHAITNYKKPASSSFLFNENIKMSRNIQQLVFNNDNDSYHHSKYYYFKSYRGPGSGNYKDAALVNRINKIHVVSNSSKIKGGNHKPISKTQKSIKKRYNNNLKGLIHEFFTKDNVDLVLDKQRRYTEDYHNIEMLHNNLQFNLLINTYRDISKDTWENYYKFKMIDFEQYNEIQRNKLKEIKKKELILKHQQQQNEDKSIIIPPSQELTDLYKPNLSDRFVEPNNYSEILNKLPVEFRETQMKENNDYEMEDNNFKFNNIPILKRPIYNSITISELNKSEFLNKVEVVKLPNANSVGWDNFKKYKN